MTKERDPRQDPRPGDVVQLNNGATAKVLKRLWIVLEVEFSHGYGEKLVWIWTWKSWSKGSTVVYVAPDEPVLLAKDEAEK